MDDLPDRGCYNCSRTGFCEMYDYLREEGRQARLPCLRWEPERKKIPVKPIIAGDHDTFCGTWYYVCPTCKISIDYQDQQCPHCSQVIDWTE